MKAAFPKALFKKYFDTLIADISILNNFEIANTNIWFLDWHAINNVKQISKGKMNWDSIPVFKSLHSFRKNPAIYFFTVNDSHNQILFSEFLKCKAGNLEIRKSYGIKDKEYFNLSHVPKLFNNGTTIYVGSVKKGLHGRLIQHLGRGSTKRTGALYLDKILKTFETFPEIKFNYIILDERYRNITEHIECVVYDKLQPFIGKRPK